MSVHLWQMPASHISAPSLSLKKTLHAHPPLMSFRSLPVTCKRADTYSLQAQAQTTFRFKAQSADPYNCAGARPVHSLWLYLCVFYMARAMDSALNQNLFAQIKISMLSADSPSGHARNACTLVRAPGENCQALCPVARTTSFPVTLFAWELLSSATK